MPEGHTVNASFYHDVLNRLSALHALGLIYGKIDLFPAAWQCTGNTATIMWQFLAQKRIPTLNHLRYSPNLSLSNYFVELKGDWYATIRDIQTSVTMKLKTIPIYDFSWVMHHLEDCDNQCIAFNGDYFE